MKLNTKKKKQITNPEAGEEYSETATENETYPIQDYINSNTTTHSYKMRPKPVKEQKQFTLMLTEQQ